ncbi:hypothetical protein GcC1_110020 [Golovinomyces cichoracearum]|uniref:Uncharacterized protein n=1 Tax=Golovinomyces cichoracearum TaxID=62708 RepID=A0A420I8T4_9PEZI|nr:hypothetical protein GcC1_110020 [Golovinomyces cichoracearum]
MKYNIYIFFVSTCSENIFVVLFLSTTSIITEYSLCIGNKMRSLCFHIIYTSIILPLIVAYPNSNQESDSFRTTNSKQLFLRSKGLPSLTTNPRPNPKSKSVRETKKGYKCHGRFYNQAKIKEYEKKFCQINAKQLRRALYVSNVPEPRIPLHIYPELDGRFVWTPISSFFNGVLHQDFIVITKEDCIAYDLITLTKKGFWRTCEIFPKQEDSGDLSDP